jgi:hypothetical protein
MPAFMSLWGAKRTWQIYEYTEQTTPTDLPPSTRQRIPGRPTGGDRFTPRGLLPRLFSRLMIALIVVWMVLVIMHYL